ncbi:DNA polymerase IV [Ureaplasma ceti]|uniref:DNA polymerase IV n=1 Tax=Ureaplasma ceti TaxID=3119530 RepID=A0ABP9U5W8_9BACT
MKVIFHIDLDAFFASVEEIYEPMLKNLPFVIAGEGKHAVISTCNYEARKYGIKSAMNVNDARKLCPDIAIVKPHHERYHQHSQQFFTFLKYSFTDSLEIVSVDECFLDVTNILPKFHNNAQLLAITIQQEIQKKLGLSVSIGISESKFLAKIATDLKKPHGISSLHLKEIKTKLYPLKIEKFIGIGKKTLPKLKNLQIFTIGDFVHSSKLSELVKLLGRKYYQYYDLATGKNVDETLQIEETLPKSVSKSLTLHTSEFELDVLLKIYRNIARNLSQELQSQKLVCQTVTIQIRYDNFDTKSKSKSLKHQFNDSSTIYQVAKDLLFELWNDDPLRLVGLSLSKLNLVQ